jgi:hypothetical protein
MFSPKAVEQAEPDHNASSGIDGLDFEVVHWIPGRLRLRVPQLRERPELASHLEKQLRACDRLRSVEIRPGSSSVILCYHAADESATANMLRSIFPGLRHPAVHGAPQTDPRRPTSSSDLLSQIEQTFQKANQRVETATGGIDLNLLIPVTLLVLSILGFAAGTVKKGKLPLPAWYDLLWFAFNTFVILNLTLSQRREFELSAQRAKAQETQ